MMGAGLLFVLTAAAACGYVGNRQRLEALQQENSDGGFAVVELFTSEGCSSCPPAEALVGRLAAGNRNRQLYILALHVDYWDHQGWKDRFSHAKYTARQQRYAAWMNHAMVYTPQLVVNGQTQVVGSDERAVLDAIQTATATPTQGSLSVEAMRTGGQRVEVTYAAEGGGSDATLVVALVQQSAQSAVKAGENAGRKLAHVQVVRDLQERPLRASDTLSLRVPENMGDGEVIAFVQQRSTGQITAAARCAI